jgi:hypothetical protein
MSDKRPEEGAPKDAAPREPADAPAVPETSDIAAPAASGEEPRHPDEPPPAAGEAASGARTSVVLAALLVVILVALVATPFWAPSVAALLPWGPRNDTAGAEALRALDERLRAVEARSAATPAGGASLDQLRGALDQANQRIAALDQRLGELAKQPQVDPQSAQRAAQAQQEAAAKLAELERRLAALEPKLAEIDPKLAALDRKIAEKPAVDPATVQSLQTDLGRIAMTQTELADRIGKLEQAVQREATIDRSDQVLLLALGRLRSAVQNSRPYAAELGAAKAFAQNRPEALAALQPLEPYADRGIPSRGTLAQRFAQTAAAVARAERAPPGDDWTDQALARIKGLVTVRRVGANAAEGSPDAAVASAEAALREGDLAGAVAALEPLQGAPAAAAKPWLDDARARLAAEAALDKAEAELTQRMAQSADADAPGKPR